MPPIIDIDDLGFDSGAHLFVRQALAGVPVGGVIRVTGNFDGWDAQLSAWARGQGHRAFFSEEDGRLVASITRGEADRALGAMSAGYSDPKLEGAVLDRAHPRCGLAARGARVEAGAPEFSFRLDSKDAIWAEGAAELYAQAVSAQWNPELAIDWSASFELPDWAEDAVVQVMTYMIENENAALVVPARFLGQIHPHFREIQALLAIQVADEARHIDVFTRRIRLKGREPALSTGGGQASLKTLLDEPDFSVAGFLFSVLGEGTFVNLLNFLNNHAPDPVTRQIARLAARDEARHVAFGMAHLEWALKREQDLGMRLALAVEARSDTLAASGGLNEAVFDSLILLAAGEFTPRGIASGYAAVQRLMLEMAEGRRARLEKLGFEKDRALRLSALHTRNFM